MKGDRTIRRWLVFLQRVRQQRPLPVWCPKCQTPLGKVWGRYELRCTSCGKITAGMRS